MIEAREKIVLVFCIVTVEGKLVEVEAKDRSDAYRRFDVLHDDYTFSHFAAWDGSAWYR